MRVEKKAFAYRIYSHFTQQCGYPHFSSIIIKLDNYSYIATVGFSGDLMGHLI